MPTEKPTGGASNTTPTRPQLMPWPTWMVYGMGLGMLTIFVRTMWFVERGDVNSMFVTAAWVLGVGIGVPALLNCRQGWKRIALVVSASLYTSVLMAGMCLFLGGTAVSNYYDDVAKIQQFARSGEFAQFEQDGAVSKQALDDAMKEQSELRWQLKQLADTHKTIDSSSGTDATKWAANAGVSALEADLKLRLLPDDEIDRMRAVSNDMHLVSSNGTATRWQLVNVDRSLHQQFPQWEWLLKQVHAID